MLNFKKLYSKFIMIVVIFLVLIGVNSLVARFMPLGGKPEVDEEIQAPAEDVVTTSSPVMNVDVDTEVPPITYESQVDDQNAFKLLQEVAEVEYKEYDFGVFVESINGVKGDDEHFWAFYLNGEQAQAGADQTILQKGDKVEWRYEEIK